MNTVKFPLSYSSYSTFKECPKKYWYNYHLRCKQKPSAALDKGNAWHKNCEDYINDNLPPGAKLIKKLESWEEGLLQLKQQKAFAEQKLCVNQAMQPVDWFSDDGFFRMILDVRVMLDHGRVLIVDFKTGKEYPTHKEQASIYAFTVFGLFSREVFIKEITAEMWYLDLKKIVALTFTEEQLHAGLKLYIDRFHALEDVTDLPPTPSKDSCKWCPYRSDKPKTVTFPEGGYCQEWRKI